MTYPKIRQIFDLKEAGAAMALYATPTTAGAACTRLAACTTCLGDDPILVFHPIRFSYTHVHHCGDPKLIAGKEQAPVSAN